MHSFHGRPSSMVVLTRSMTSQLSMNSSITTHEALSQEDVASLETHDLGTITQEGRGAQNAPISISEVLDAEVHGNVTLATDNEETSMDVEDLDVEKTPAKKSKVLKSTKEEIGVIPLSFHMDMLSVLLEELRLHRPSPPPMVPLCRIFSHEAIRTVGSQRLLLKETYKREGYIIEKGDFVLSLCTFSGKQILVKDYTKALWDPVWEQLSNEFDDAIRDDPYWSDMCGCMFICWDGNHRHAGWMEAIQEDFKHDISRHVSVRASFIHPTQEGEMRLLASMNRINRLNEFGIVKTDLKDQLYSVRRVAECNADFFRKKFTPEQLQDVEKIRQMEAKKSGSTMWYPLTRYMLAKVLFEADIEKELEEARSKYNVGFDKKHKSLKDAEAAVQYKWITKMGKLLGAVNPSLGREWFAQVVNMEPQGHGFYFGLEKLHALRCSTVKNEVRNRWLSISLSTLRADYGIPNSDKDYRLWVAKETWLEYLVEQANDTLKGCLSIESFELPRSMSLTAYITKFKSTYRKQMFSAIEPCMDYSREGKEHEDIVNSAKRVVWRYMRHFLNTGEVQSLPDILSTWSQVDIPSTSMYSEKYQLSRKGGLSTWEVLNNPWWLDFPEGRCPEEEKELFEMYKKGKLHATKRGVCIDDPLVDVAEKLDSRLRDGKGIVQNKYARKKFARREHFERQNTNHVGEKSDDWRVPKRKRDEFEYCPPKVVATTGSSQLHVIHGNIMSISKAFNERTLSKEMAEVRQGLLSCCGEGRRRRGKTVDYSADLMLLDFPSNMIPDGFTTTVPSWNILPEGMMDAGLQLVSAVLDDSGFAICVVSTNHQEVFFRTLRRTGLILQGSFCLRGVEPFGVCTDGIQIFSLCVYVLGRENCLPLHVAGGGDDLDPQLFKSDSNTWTHYFPATHRFLDPSTSMPFRGGQEKSPLFIQFLVETYCRKDGVVFDPMVGCGSTILACRAAKRHCVVMDFDSVLLGHVDRLYRSPTPSIVHANVAMEEEEERIDNFNVDDFCDYCKPYETSSRIQIL